MSDAKALILEAREWAEAGMEAGFSPAEISPLLERLADALEAATADRAVVEAQALEQAADEWGAEIRSGGAASWLRARAVEIREGRQ